MQWIVTVIRVLVGAFFVMVGLPKFLDHAKEVREFRHWGLPEPSLFAYATGSVEIVAGLAMLLGVLTPVACLMLAGNMVGAFATAGRIDGGFHLVAPPILLTLSLGIMIAGGGRAQLAPGAWLPIVGRLVRPRGASMAVKTVGPDQSTQPDS